MVKTVLYSESDNMAQKRLVEMKGKMTWKALADVLKMNQGYLYRVAHGDRKASGKLRHALGLSHTIRADIPVCPVCDKPYEPRHKCESKPRTPRRKYDMSNREARDIGLGLLAVLNTSPLRNAPELRRRLALKRRSDGMG